MESHNWFFLKSLTANCSWPNAARPILNTAHEIASTIGVKTRIIRQSIGCYLYDKTILRLTAKTAAIFITRREIK